MMTNSKKHQGKQIFVDCSFDVFFAKNAGITEL